MECESWCAQQPETKTHVLANNGRRCALRVRNCFASAAGDYAYHFDAIAFRNLTRRPFPLMQRDPVVLDQNSMWLKS
jgi:hypothetical protein